MAGAEGFEPSARGFGDRRSTRLSYAPRPAGKFTLASLLTLAPESVFLMPRLAYCGTRNLVGAVDPVVGAEVAGERNMSLASAIHLHVYEVEEVSVGTGDGGAENTDCADVAVVHRCRGD